MEFIKTEAAPTAVGPYSQAVCCGDLLFCSGMIPLDPESGQVAGEDVVIQTRQVFYNLRGLLGSQNLELNQVVKTTVFLDDMSSFAAFNEVYAEEFGGHKPARSTVEVAKLPLGVLVEIECIVSCKNQE